MRHVLAVLLLMSAIVLAGCGGGGGGGQALTVTDDSGAVIQIDPSQSSLTVEPAGKPVANGADQVRVVVTVRDVNGQPVANLRVSAEVSGTGNTLTQPAGLTGVDGRASATLSSTVAEIKTCKGFIGATEIPQTGQVEFVAGPPTQLVFVVPPSTVVQDTCMTPPVVVGLRDAFGNACTTATNDVTVALGQNPGSGSLIGVTTVAAVAGQATFDKLSLDMPADGYTLTAASAAVQGATSAAFHVLSGVGPGCAGGLPTSPRVAFVQQPGTTAAGGDFSVQVALQDSLGNTLTTRTDAITLSLSTNPTGDTLQGTLTANAVAGVATFSGLKLEKASTGYRLGAAAARFASGTSDPFEVTAGAADHLAVLVEPSNAQAGVALTPGVQIALKDVYGNTRTGATESVSVELATNPSGAALSGTRTQAPLNGVATFADLSLDLVGLSYALKATSPGSTSVTTANFDITPGAPSQLQFVVQPPVAQAGRAMDPAPQVRLLDAFGNPVPSGGVTVKVALGANPGAGTLSGDQESVTVNGAATFANLKVDKVGAAYTLVATAVGYSGVESAAFSVVPGQASTLKFTTQPPAGPTMAGEAFAAAVSVYDAQGNLVSDSTAPITVALLNNGSGAVLGGTLTVNASGGVATFSDLTVDRTQAGYALAATAAGLVGAESSAFAITHAAADALIYVTPPQSTSAGTAFTAELMLVDRFGNTITSDSTSAVTVLLTFNPTQAALKGTLTRTVTQGEVSFTDLQLDVVGTYALGAQTGGGLTADSGPFEIGSAAAARLVFATPPADVVAGQVFSCGVQVQDAYGNPVTSYADPIALTLGGGRVAATMTGTNPKTPTAGTATFDDLAIDLYGSNYKLTASSGALTAAVVDPLVVALPATPVTWYVDNTATPGGTGFSADPFATLAEAQATSRASDTIVVRIGDGTPTGYLGGITLKANQTLRGESNVIVGPVIVASNCTVQTLRVTNNMGGTAVTHVPGAVGGTLAGVTLLNSQKGFVFNGVSGTWTLDGCVVGGGFSGEAVELTNSPTAIFAFRDLTVYSGKGLVANNAGQLSATGTNSVTATGAAALNISNLAVPIDGLTFADLTSTDSTGNGLAFVNLTGLGGITVTGTANVVRPQGTGLWVHTCLGKAFNFAAVTVTNGAAGGIDTGTGNSGSNFTYGNVAITNSGGAGLLAFGGGLTVGGGSIATTGAPCLDLDSVVLDGSGLVLSSASSTNSTSVGMKLTHLGGQPVNISGGALSGAFGTGFQVNGGSANITYAGNVTNTSAGMRVVSVSQRSGGTVTLTGLVTDNGGAGGGVLISSNTAGSTVFGGACNLAVGANETALAINNSGGSVSFPNGSLTASATGAGAIAMRVTGTGMTTVSGAGNTLLAIGGAVSFLASGGPGVDFNGNVNHTSTARAVDIQNTTGGTIRFLTGAVSSQGPNGGVYVANCAGALSFANLNLGNNSPLTTSIPVSITGGTGAVGLGQVNLTSGNLTVLRATDMGGTLSSTGGLVTAGTGTAVLVDGPVGRTPLAMVLTRVSSNGAANGLVLRDVNGSFEVTGDGGASANGSGGTIQNGTTGVVLERAAGVKLRRMNLAGHTDFGLSANLADALTMQLLNVTNCGNGVGDAGMWMQDPRGLGTVSSCTVTASATGDQAFRVVESSGGAVQSRVTIDGSTFQDTYTSAIGSDALEARAATGGNLRVDVTGSTFRNTRTNGLQFLAEGTGRGALYVGNSTFTDVGAGLSLEASGTTAGLTFDVYNNPQITAKSGFGGTLLNLFTAGSATATGSFRGNTLTGAGNTVAFGHGVRVNVNEASSAVVAVTNSTIGSVTQSGIQATSRAGTGRLDLTVSGNSIPSAPGYGIELVAQDTNTLYANVFNNLCASPGVAAFRVRPADAGSFVYLQGFVDTVANVWAAGNNSPVGSVAVSGLGTVAAGTPLTP